MKLEDILGALSACVCAEFSDVCQCGILPGNQAAIDHCGPCTGNVCGQAWVLLQQVYTSTSFPTPDSGGSCGSYLAASIQVGVARCAPVPGADGSPPDQEDLTEAGLQGAADAVAAYRAVTCCLDDLDVQYATVNWATGAPSGGCVTGMMQVLVEVTG